MLADIRIHESTWSNAARERRREWVQLIKEILEHPPRDGEHPLRLTVTPCEGKGTIFGFETLEGRPSFETVLPDEALRPHFREYCEICHRMWLIDEGSHSARLEALDMGKKIAHDRAARTLMELCAPLAVDLATARRLFSLLISVHFDTGRMARGHRVCE